MCPNANFSALQFDKYDYLPAVLKENKSGWLIEYYVENPQTKILTRKQIRLTRLVSRYKNKNEARRHISKIIVSINSKLAGGWNPFFHGEDARMYEKLNNVCEFFLKEKRKELRTNTIRSYESFCRMLLSFLKSQNENVICSMFNQSYAIRYMDYLYNERNVNANTYNNQIKLGRAFFNWCMEHNYSKQNPFLSIKKKAKAKKTRILIPKETREQITNYLIETNNIPFLIICQLVFDSLIRPKEILLIQIKHIHINERYIIVPDENSKNHKTRFSAITPGIIENLKLMNIDNFPEDYYLFGGSLTPSEHQAGYKRAGKEWDKMRKALQLPDEMQLYSLRDSGIFEMLKSGIDDLSVMQHADHSSLDVTTRYADHLDENLINKIYMKAPKF